MGFIKYMMGQTKILEAKDPEIQKMLTYMYEKYDAYIEDMSDRKNNAYYICCRSKKYFNYLYSHGYLNNGFVQIPGQRPYFDSIVDAYADGLLWLYNLFKGIEENKKKDAEWF